jgi:hypothetical protein
MTLTPLEKQRAREAKELEAAARSRGRLPPGPPLPADFEVRCREIARYVEPILHANAQLRRADEGVAEAYRVVTLFEKMGVTDGELVRAVETMREYYWTWVGRSSGVSSYGDFVQAAPASERSGTTDRRIKARLRLERCIKAMFSVETADGGRVWDMELADLVIPALFNSQKGLTQADIGRLRTRYAGRAQVGAAGGAVILEAVIRLALHLRIREGVSDDGLPYQRRPGIGNGGRQ